MINHELVLTGIALRLTHAPRIRASARRMRDSRMEWKRPGGAERQNCSLPLAYPQWFHPHYLTLSVSALDTNSATDTLCSTLTSCLDNFCPFHPDQHALPPLPLVVRCLREHRTKLRLQRGNGTNLKTLPTLVCISHTFLPSLQMSPLLK